MNSEVKYLAIYQGQDPRVETDHLNPETIREIVGGDYEVIFPWGAFDIGVFRNKERNHRFARIVQRAFYGKDENGSDNKEIYYVSGPFIVAAVKDFESGTLRSLDDWEINHYKNVLLRGVDDAEEEEEDLLEDSKLLKAVYELEALLNVSDKYADSENDKGAAPSVWQIQNAHIREKVVEIKNMIESDFDSEEDDDFE